MASSTINHVPPAEMLPTDLSSNSDYIVSRRFRTFNTEVGGNYSYSSNNTFRITLNSASEFLAGANSYLEFKLLMSLPNAGGLAAGDQVRRYLDHCGHSLFSSFKIQLSNGTVLEQLDGYNKLYSIIDHWTVADHHRNNVEGPYSADSTNKFRVKDSDLTDKPLSGDYTANVVNASSTYTNANRTLVVAGGKFLTEVSVGDVVVVNGLAGIVQSITNDTTLIFAVSIGNDIAAGGITSVASRGPSSMTSRARACTSTTAVSIRLKPFSNLLQSMKLLPLFYLKNLQLIFTLERPDFVMTLIPTPNNNIQVDYVLSDIKYQACLIQPSDEILEIYRTLYNSEDKPIEIPYVSYQHNMKYANSVPVGPYSFTIPASCRSARSIISAFYSVYSETISTATNFTVNVDSVSQTIKNGCVSYSYKIGSEQYPSFDKADVSGVFNGEMLAWNLLALGVHGNTLQHTSIKPQELFVQNRVKAARNGAAVADVVDSTRACFAAHLSRSDSAFTGADLLSNDIIAEFTFSQMEQATDAAQVNPADIYIRSWICHDRVLSIHRSGIVVKY